MTRKAIFYHISIPHVSKVQSHGYSSSIINRFKMSKNKKICCFFNYPSHYRKSIYAEMGKELNCAFIFGDEVPTIKEFDCSILNNVKRVHYRHLFKRVVWVSEVIKTMISQYNTYIVTPATNSLTHWLLLLLTKIIPGKKIFFWTHGYYGNESPRQRFFKRRMFLNADGLFLYGDYSKELMLRDGFDAKKLHVIHNSLNYEEHIKLRDTTSTSKIYQEHFNNDHATIVVIGRVNKRKKLDILVDAVHLLHKEHFHVNVMIIGEGEALQSLKQETIQSGIDKYFWFYGACYDERKNAELIYNADLCVVPGDIGLTAIHAMTFGVPVISHDYFPTQGPEFEVIVPGVSGDFFVHDDTRSLCETIKKWFITNADKRNEVRQQCYNVIDEGWNPNYQMEILKRILV